MSEPLRDETWDEPVGYYAEQDALASWDADAPDPGSVQTPADESEKAAEWASMELMARAFVQVYGPAALLRCISPAVQPE